MESAYFHVRFRTPEPDGWWPEAFAIVTAYHTTGQTWPATRNREADAALREVLRDEGCWTRRLTGYHPVTGHAEPGWAAALPFPEACDLGARFLQDAIYWVEGDVFAVSHCDDRRAAVPVGSFRERLDC